LRHDEHFTRCYGAQGLRDVRDKRLQVAELGAPGSEDDDAYLETRDVLLEAEISICRQEDIESDLCTTEQFAVLDPRPACFHDRVDFEPRKISPKGTRNILIE
jgi:hypothetical protein